jgi:hypothetical protein
MEVVNYARRLWGVSSSPRSWRIGGQWRENKVLPKNPQSEHTVSWLDIQLVVTW